MTGPAPAALRQVLSSGPSVPHAARSKWRVRVSRRQRPSPCRLLSFRRVIWPSTGPMLQGTSSAASSAVRARCHPAATVSMAGSPQVVASASHGLASVPGSPARSGGRGRSRRAGPPPARRPGPAASRPGSGSSAGSPAARTAPSRLCQVAVPSDPPCVMGGSSSGPACSVNAASAARLPALTGGYGCWGTPTRQSGIVPPVSLSGSSNSTSRPAGPSRPPGRRRSPTSCPGPPAAPRPAPAARPRPDGRPRREEPGGPDREADQRDVRYR